MENLRLELIEVITHCCDVKTFRFELPEDVPYIPGQYLVLTLDIGGKKVPKAFSISSSPTEKGYIEFTKKVSDSQFSRTLESLEIGRAYDIRMPMGKFTFEGEHPKAAFLSGGIGITPIRSIFKYATDMRLPSHLVLLYSSRTPEYLIFRNDFSVMQKANKNIKVIYTLTHCDERVEGCRAGYIDGDMVKNEVPDYSERPFYICGPPGMVDGMSSMLLKKLSIPMQHIITEDFLGY
ncbi:MAG TPA: xylene monooxygenase [Candidatus Omnitrophica bacterium]|nr:xylene monooxygenase [Candidatus Omnitrophota bacterium]